MAQVAIQGARFAAKQIITRLRGRTQTEPFRYVDKGSMATISRFRAVVQVGRFRLTGLLAWLMWLAVHLVYITGFTNRVTALMHWAVSFVGRRRSERTTTVQQVLARRALEQVADGEAGDRAEDHADSVGAGRSGRSAA